MNGGPSFEWYKQYEQPDKPTNEQQWINTDQLDDQWYDIQNFLKQSSRSSDEQQQFVTSLSTTLQTTEFDQEAAVDFVNYALNNSEDKRPSGVILDWINKFLSNTANERKDEALIYDFIETEHISNQKKRIKEEINQENKQIAENEKIIEKQNIDIKKAIQQFRDYLTNGVATITTENPIYSEAINATNSLSEQTKEKLAANNIPEEQYVMSKFIITQPKKAQEHLPTDVFEHIMTGQETITSFEKALDIEPWHADSSEIAAWPDTASLSKIGNPAVYNNVKELYTEHEDSVTEAVGSKESYVNSLTDDQEKLFRIFPDIFMVGQNSEIQVDKNGQPEPNRLVWVDIAKQLNINPKDPASEKVLHGLMSEQIHTYYTNIGRGNMSLDNQHPLHNRYMAQTADRQQYVTTLSNSLYQWSKDVVSHTSVDSFCDSISSVCGAVGDKFSFDPKMMKYDKETGLTIPFTLQGIKINDPLVFGKTISWPQIMRQDKEGEQQRNIGYTQSATIAEWFPTIEDGIANTHIDRKTLMNRILEDTPKNPLDAMKNAEADIVRGSMNERFSRQQVELQATVKRYLADLESQQATKHLAVQTIAVQQWLGPDASTDLANRLDNPDQELTGDGYGKDVFQAAKLVNNTNSSLPSDQIEKVTHAITTIQNKARTLSDFNSMEAPVKDPLIRQIADRHQEQPSDTPLSDLLGAFVTNMSRGSRFPKMDPDALTGYADYIESPAAKEMSYEQYIESGRGTMPMATTLSFSETYKKIEIQQADKDLDALSHSYQKNDEGIVDEYYEEYEDEAEDTSEQKPAYTANNSRPWSWWQRSSTTSWQLQNSENA